MKRAGFPLAAGCLAALLNAGLTPSARADCAGDVKSLQSAVPLVQDPKRREELTKLLEKALKDDQAGRAELCADAVQRARALLK